MYGTYSEVTPLSYNFLSKPGVLWKLMKRKHFEKHALFSLFWPKKRVLELNMGLFNSPEISTSNKLHCRIIWLNIKGVECKKVRNIWRRIVRMVVSYPYPSCFLQYAAYLRRPYSVTGFINQWGGGVKFGYLSTFLHYVNANVISFSYKTNSSLTRHF